MAAMETKTEGWTWLFNATKDHYFVDGRSLCGRWMLLGTGSQLQKDDGRTTRDRCKGCRKAQDGRIAAKGVQDA